MRGVGTLVRSPSSAMVAVGQRPSRGRAAEVRDGQAQARHNNRHCQSGPKPSEVCGSACKYPRVAAYYTSICNYVKNYSECSATEPEISDMKRWSAGLSRSPGLAGVDSAGTPLDLTGSRSTGGDAHVYG